MPRSFEMPLGLTEPALVEAEEVERRRVARELHDDIGQGLALLTIEIERPAPTALTAPSDITNRNKNIHSDQ